MYRFEITRAASISDEVLRYQCLLEQEKMSVGAFIEALINSTSFREALSTALSECPFPAFFFELPPVTVNDLFRPFEFVLVNSRILPQIQANPKAFAEHFSQENAVVSFPNLGGDAQLIVPCPLGDADYAQLASFLRSAPAQQLEEFWQLVGKTYQNTIGSQPKWLSTAGLGVSWLHLRIDSRPKYYRHQPYKNYPATSYNTTD